MRFSWSAAKALARRRPACTVHDTVEKGWLPYCCCRCFRCFVCGHTLTPDRLWWVCHDGGRIHTRVSPGIPVGTRGRNRILEPEIINGEMT